MPTSWTLLWRFLRRRINIKNIQSISSRGSHFCIGPQGNSKQKWKSKTQLLSYCHCNVHTYFMEAHGRGDHHFYWNSTAKSQDFTIHAKHSVFLGIQPVFLMFAFNRWYKMTKTAREHFLYVHYTKLQRTLVSTGLF